MKKIIYPIDLYSDSVGVPVPVISPSTVTFRAFDSGSSTSNLPQAMTLNGITVGPICRYEGKRATAATWLGSVGPALAIAGSGTLPTVGLDTGLTDDTDKAVLFTGGQCYANLDPTFGNLGSVADNVDMVVELVLNVVVPTNTKGLISKRAAFTGAAGWHFAEAAPDGRFRFTLSDGVITVAAANVFNHVPGLVHLMGFLDRSESTAANAGGIWQNGVSLAAFATAPTLLTGSITNAAPFVIGADSSFNVPTTNSIIYAAVYQRANWFPGGAANLTAFNAISKERTARVCGVFPSIAVGSGVPVTMTRSTTVVMSQLDKLTAGVRRLWPVGSNWMRTCRRVELVGGEVVTGVLLESQKQNLIFQSETFDSATWIKTACAVTANGGVSPDAQNTADCIVADATNAQHIVSQAVTVTAAAYVFSVWAKKGDRNFLLMEDTTVVNAKAWFDLNTGVVGTVGAGVSEARIENWGNGLFRCAIRFLGTAASHTFRLSPANADNTSTFSGDAATVSICVWGAQVEQSDHATSYSLTTTALTTRTGDVLSYTGNDGNIAASSSMTASLDYLGFNADLAANQVLLLAGGTVSSVNPNGFSIQANSTDLAVGNYTTGSATQMSTSSTSDPSDGEKHVLKITAAANSGKLFFDGVQEGATDTSLTLFSTAPVLIAVNSTGNALIANVQIDSAVI